MVACFFFYVTAVIQEDVTYVSYIIQQASSTLEGHREALFFVCIVGREGKRRSQHLRGCWWRGMLGDRNASQVLHTRSKGALVFVRMFVPRLRRVVFSFWIPTGRITWQLHSSRNRIWRVKNRGIYGFLGPSWVLLTWYYL